MEPNIAIHSPREAKPVECSRHKKLVEYFCKDCGLAVCSKCMFNDHNGHRLSEINEVVKLVLKEMDKVKLKIEAAQIVNTHNINFLKHIQENIEELKDKQIENITSGFDAIYKELEAKKLNMQNLLVERYQTEIEKKAQLMKPFNNADTAIKRITKSYQSYLRLHYDGKDAEMLLSFLEIQKFVNDSKSRLEDIIKEVGINKSGFRINKDLKPIKINTEKVLRLIGNFKVDTKQNVNLASSQQKQVISLSYKLNSQKMKSSQFNSYQKLPPLESNNEYYNTNQNSSVKMVGGITSEFENYNMIRNK